jgi:hypothetical protein
VAPIALVGEDALDSVAEERFHFRDDDCQSMAVIGIAGQRLHMGDELPAPGVCQRGGDRDLGADLWTTPALQEESTKGKAVCANLSGFKLGLSPRAIMDIRPLLSSITRRPQDGPWRRTRLQKCRWNRFSIRPFRLANQGRLLCAFRSGRSCILCGVAQEIGVVVTTLCEHAPSHACEFCSQGNDQYIRVEPLGRCF